MNARNILSIAAFMAASILTSGQLSLAPESRVSNSENMIIEEIPGGPVNPGAQKVNPSHNVYAATIPAMHGAADTFKIGECIITDERNNLTVYFNCQGRIVEKRCADFFRTGKMDSTELSLAGPVKDYYTNDTLALEAFLENGMLKGPATFYHRNGKVMAKGRYSENNRTGVWTYFYDNGNPEKIINFVRGYPFIVAYHERNGKQSVVQGNGRYRNKFKLGSDCSPYGISGKVVEGMLHGKWKIYADFNHQKVATEYYDHGKFIRRKSIGKEYTGQPMIRIQGYNPNESLLWTESIAGCATGNYQVMRYRGQDLHARFYPELLDTLNSIALDTLHDQWLITGIQLARDNIVHTVKIRSSILDRETEDRIRQVLKSMVHFSIDAQFGNADEVQFMFTILFRDNRAIIPADIYYKEWMKSMQQFDRSD